MTDTDGRSLFLSLDATLPTGVVMGLSSPSGASAAEQICREHQLIIDLLAGVLIPAEGAVVIAPQLTIGVVPVRPMFSANSTILETLTYGLYHKLPERVIWQ